MRAREKPFRFEGRHAAHARGRDRLAENLVLHVAGGEHARHIGARGIRRGADIAFRVHVELAVEQLRCRRMADGDEEPVDRQRFRFARAEIADSDRAHRTGIVGAQHFVDAEIVDHVDLGVGREAHLVRLVGAQHGAAMDERHALGEIGEEQCFLGRGVAAADDGHALAAEEEAVTGGASRNAEALVFRFRGKAEPVGRRARGDNESLGHVARAGIAHERERPPREIDRVDRVLHQLGADMFGLRLHLLHEPGALDRFCEARIILDFGGDGELAARLDAGDHDGLQHCARRIDRGRGAGGAAPQNDDFGVHGASQVRTHRMRNRK